MISVITRHYIHCLHLRPKDYDLLVHLYIQRVDMNIL